MYIAIYVSAIVLLCAGAITFFVIKDKHNQKLGEKLKQKAKEENPAILDEHKDNLQDEQSKDLSNSENLEKSSADTEKKNELEDFSLEIEEKEQKKHTNFNLNPFSLDDGFTGHEQNANAPADFEDEQSEDGDLDKKFKEYEDFLRRNLDLDDDDLNDKDDDDRIFDNEFDDVEFPNEDSKKINYPGRLDDDDLRALQNFDYDSLKGKNEEEIAEIIKSLPPKAQEILMSDILARRKFDDEE